MFTYSLFIFQLILLLSIALWAYSLIDILRNEFEKNNKIIWIITTIFVPVLGSIFYLFIGRKQKIKVQ
jgi:hypothetical protein